MEARTTAKLTVGCEEAACRKLRELQVQRPSGRAITRLLNDDSSLLVPTCDWSFCPMTCAFKDQGPRSSHPLGVLELPEVN